MTIIEDDHVPSAESDASKRIEEYGARVEDSTKRIAAAITGALEGFVGALDKYDVTNEGRRAIHQAGDISRAAAVEGKSLAQTPEMRQVGEGLRHMGEKTGDATHRAADAVRDRASHAKESFSETVESVRYRVDHAREEAKVKAQAVAETGRRARVAPRAIGSELGGWFAAWKRGLTRSLAGMALMAVFGVLTLIVLTIALVVGLNEVIGDPQGTFVVAAIYAVVAGIAYAVARAAKTRAAHEREERLANAREEMRYVARPVKEAFSRGRTNI